MVTKVDTKYDRYVQDRLTQVRPYTPSSEDEKIIKTKGVSEWIARKLLRTNFRRSKLTNETMALVQKKVAEAISSNQPLKIILGVGGYKHFAIRSFPKPNWAEFFNLMFLREWLAPVLAVHPAGIQVEYESEDIILEIANGYSRENLDAYSDAFRSLLTFVNTTNPQGLSFGYVRARDQYDATVLKQKMELLIPVKLQELEGLNPVEREERIKRSGRNLMPGFSESPLRAKAINLAFLDADFELRGSYFDAPGTVPVVFTFGTDVENVGSWPVIGSTRSSFTDFWVGEGILEDRGERIIECVFSPKQFADKQNLLQSYEISGIPFEHLKIIEVLQNN